MWNVDSILNTGLIFGVSIAVGIFVSRQFATVARPGLYIPVVALVRALFFTPSHIPVFAGLLPLPGILTFSFIDSVHLLPAMLLPGAVFVASLVCSFIGTVLRFLYRENR